MPCRHIAELTGGGLTERGWEARGRGKVRMPLPWLNVINGGAHAGNRLAVQVGALRARIATFVTCLRATACLLLKPVCLLLELACLHPVSCLLLALLALPCVCRKS